MTITDPMYVVAGLLFVAPGGVLAMFSRAVEELAPALIMGGIGVFSLSLGIKVSM